MRIGITGGTGFIGRHLIDFLKQQAEIVLISRTSGNKSDSRLNRITWEELEEDGRPLEGLDAIIHLAGESINQRWTASAKERIIDSRVKTTIRLARLIERLEKKPKTVISGSAIGIYGTSEIGVFDEQTPCQAEDFLAQVVEQWERAADLIGGIRVVKLRTGLVLGKDGGAFPKMMLPYRLGLGGRVGNGKQWMSWIHVDDLVRLIWYCIKHDDISGPVNATAPNPVTNDQFGRVLGNVLQRPHLFPVPAFLLELMFGEMSMLVLKGQRVLPKKLIDHGFSFSYPNIESALKDLIKNT